METGHPLAVVCRILAAPRSTVYARRFSAEATTRPGPQTAIGDDTLVGLIRQVIAESPFCGEGYRKIRARLRREHEVRVSGKRVLRLMRRHGLLAPHRDGRRRVERPHVGTIVPDAPNVRWGVDGTLGWTRDDGWVWVFGCIDHFTAEAWSHVAKTGDRFAALQPVYDAVMDRWGQLAPDMARGLSVRHDWGSQYRSHHFTGSLRWLGMTDDPAYPGEPEGNGCIERWMRTLKEQCLWARIYDDVDDLRQAVAAFTYLYNNEWLIERHGHATPREAYQAATAQRAA
jgi:transposase InsO family protein